MSLILMVKKGGGEGGHKAAILSYKEERKEREDALSSAFGRELSLRPPSRGKPFGGSRKNCTIKKVILERRKVRGKALT